MLQQASDNKHYLATDVECIIRFILQLASDNKHYLATDVV